MMWNLWQQMQIQNLRATSVLARSEAQLQREATRRRGDDLEDDLARLALVTQALWTFVQERLGVTDQELLARVLELDRADGAADGRARRRARPCPSCHATVPADRAACQFCGAGTPGVSPFA